jgi:hypothetical protein
MNKRFGTLGTAERFFPSVNAHVSAKINWLREWFFTIWTLEGFLPRMHEWMSFQVTWSSKRVRAKRTAKWFLPCMSSNMFLQMAFDRKRLGAKRAVERFLSCVHFNMVSEALSSCKRFRTIFTAMKLALWPLLFLSKINKVKLKLNRIVTLIWCSCAFVNGENVAPGKTKLPILQNSIFQNC